MQDRLVAGALAGMAGAFIQFLYGTAIEGMGISTRLFKNLSEVVITYKDYHGPIAFIVGFIAHLTVGIMFGVLFAYIIARTSSRYLWFKGLGYSLVLWFLLSGFGTIFKLPVFKGIPPVEALLTLIGAFIYGIVTAYAMRVLDKKTSLI